MQTPPWTAERIELLQKLWAEGETAASIAARLGGISRSAVLGKVFRLRLPVAGRKPARLRAGKPAPKSTAQAGSLHRRGGGARGESRRHRRLRRAPAGSTRRCWN